MFRPAGGGVFIVLEGGEGSGKGSVGAAMSQWMQAQGLAHLCTREPGGTPEGAQIRKALIESGNDWDPVSELLLMAADRRQHIQKVILPALRQGQVVLCDRFAFSTEAYQGAGRQLPMALIEQLHAITVGDLQPDLVVLLDVDPRIGLARSRKRLAAQGSSEDLFERLDLGFHERVRNSFLQQAARDAQRWTVLDASQALNDVIATAIGALSRLGVAPSP